VTKPTVVVVETLKPPRATSVRVAVGFSQAQLTEVLLCHWHHLDFSGLGVAVAGPAYRVSRTGELQLVRAFAGSSVKAMFFYGPNSGLLTGADVGALQQLLACGIDVRGLPLYKVVDRLLLAASQRGVVTNALGSSRGWGPKHQQERKLRLYESATGRRVLRPRTDIARASELAGVLRVFAADESTCVVKPTGGEGGRGLAIVSPGGAAPRVGGAVVVQRLVPDPLLVKGHKADIRFFLLMDVDREEVSGRIGPILVRRAAAPYVAGRLEAEITNTAFRVRRGFYPDIHPLELVTGLSWELRDWIVSEVRSLARELVAACFWHSARECAVRPESRVPNRVILFGIDVLVAGAEGRPLLYFLEMNPFPGFFRGVRDSDAAIDAMISREYLPLFLRAASE
jgi:Tubulin-tyrosine ligase family